MASRQIVTENGRLMIALTDQDLVYIHNRLSHEDDLINQRISWLVNSQSFLLTAYAITLNGFVADQTKPMAHVQRKLLSLLPLVGIGCVLLVCVALIGGLMAMGHLRRFAATKLPKDRLFLISKPTTQYLGVSAPVLIPIVFLVIWGVLYF